MIYIATYHTFQESWQNDAKFVTSNFNDLSYRGYEGYEYHSNSLMPMSKHSSPDKGATMQHVKENMSMGPTWNQQVTSLAEILAPEIQQRPFNVRQENGRRFSWSPMRAGHRDSPIAYADNWPNVV